MKKLLALLLGIMIVHPVLAQTTPAQPSPPPAVEAAPAAIAPSPAPVPTGTISITEAYAFVTAPVQKDGAAFVTIVNAGAADKLLSASVLIADKVEIHHSMMEDDTMMMVKLDALDIPAGETVTFNPNNYHLMLIGLHDPLTPGELFPLKLVFEKKGEVSVDVTVRMPGEEPAEAAPTMDHSGHHMPEATPPVTP
jgi:copper(I)-binding protein